jgi:ABC-2 family transporter protein
MTWMTWRQHRGAAAVGGAALLAIATGLVLLGITSRSNVRHVGLSSCLRTGSDCSIALAQLQRDYHWLPPAAASLIALPLLAGMFWGAPLIAREIETGTHRLVWTQSVSRLRWISTKLGLVLGVTAATTLALSLLAVWAFQPLIPILGNRFRGDWFDVQGIVPAAYMLFAVALGTCVGAVWRRTTPAMAATMVAYVAVRLPVHNLRSHLLSQNLKTSGLAPGDWILSQQPTGAPTSGTPSSGPPAAIYRYIPAGRFWTLQAVEAAIFLLLTTALAQALQ